MTEPPIREQDPTLASLLDEARALAIHLATFRVSSSINASEKDIVNELEAAQRAAVDSINAMIAARTATATLDS